MEGQKCPRRIKNIKTKKKRKKESGDVKCRHENCKQVAEEEGRVEETREESE